MKSVIDAILGFLALFTLGFALESLYKVVKTETVIKVHRGLPSLERYTQKLTGTKLKY